MVSFTITYVLLRYAPQKSNLTLLIPFPASSTKLDKVASYVLVKTKVC